LILLLVGLLITVILFIRSIKKRLILVVFYRCDRALIVIN
jgi:hypothetical protein